MTLNSVKIAALVFLSVTGGRSVAQLVCHNQFPCAECAVYDNNGNDLRGFINNNKKELYFRGEKVNEYSNNTWGYLQIKNAHVPSMDKKGNLNYEEYIDATLALYKTEDAAKATWMARECNSPNGPMVYIRVKDEGKLEIDNVKYTEITHELEQKKCAIVEYYDNTYNDRDYDVFLKNYILMEAGTVKDVAEYKGIIDFYNGFLSKFSYTSDPILTTKSFVTFFTVGGSRYFGYFNVVNNKLAGRLELYPVEYEKDRATLVNDAFRKLTGHVLYVYGDVNFGMDKTINKYCRDNHIKLAYWNTSADRKFNDDK
jgi:hypothetical protein